LHARQTISEEASTGCKGERLGKEWVKKSGTRNNGTYYKKEEQKNKTKLVM